MVADEQGLIDLHIHINGTAETDYIWVDANRQCGEMDIFIQVSLEQVFREDAEGTVDNSASE